MNGGDPVEPGVNERVPIKGQLWRVRTASAIGRSGGLSSKANFPLSPSVLAMHELDQEDNRVIGPSSSEVIKSSCWTTPV